MIRARLPTADRGDQGGLLHALRKPPPEHPLPVQDDADQAHLLLHPGQDLLPLVEVVKGRARSHQDGRRLPIPETQVDGEAADQVGTVRRGETALQPQALVGTAVLRPTLIDGTPLCS